jgi:hypothetical protein
LQGQEEYEVVDALGAREVREEERIRVEQEKKSRKRMAESAPRSHLPIKRKGPLDVKKAKLAGRSPSLAPAGCEESKPDRVAGLEEGPGDVNTMDGPLGEYFKNLFKKPKKKPHNETTARKPSRCGICKEVGHDKRKCPKKWSGFINVEEK